jgi:hypothetical protein
MHQRKKMESEDEFRTPPLANASNNPDQAPDQEPQNDPVKWRYNYTSPIPAAPAPAPAQLTTLSASLPARLAEPVRVLVEVAKDIYIEARNESQAALSQRMEKIRGHVLMGENLGPWTTQEVLKLLDWAEGIKK